MFDAVIKTMPLDQVSFQGSMISTQDLMRQLYISGGFKGSCSALATAIWNNNTKAIVNQLPSCLHVNSRYTNNKFTPMTLSAIQGNMPAMEALKAKGADLNAKDVLGYTALHHMAMLGNEAGVKQLLDWNASPELRTSHGATYMDLLRFTAPFRNASLPLDPKLFSAHTNDYDEFDEVCIPPDATLAEEMVAAPAMLVALYAQEAANAEAKKKQKLSPHLEKEQEMFLASYDTFKKNPPIVAMKLRGNKLENFCGLVAQQLIKKDELIAEYTGQLSSPGWYPSYKDGTYIWADYPAVDGGPFRSPAAMANDGFPNAAVIALGVGSKQGLDGLPNRKFLYALENIKEGEEIRISYGRKHDLKTDSNYKMLGFKALQKYLKSHSWNTIHQSAVLSLTGQATPGTSPYLNGISAKEKIFYLLDSPSVLKNLAREGTITKKDIDQIRKIGKELYNLIDPEGEEFREKALNNAIKALGQQKKTEL